METTSSTDAWRPPRPQHCFGWSAPKSTSGPSGGSSPTRLRCTKRIPWQGPRQNSPLGHGGCSTRTSTLATCRAEPRERFYGFGELIKLGIEPASAHTKKRIGRSQPSTPLDPRHLHAVRPSATCGSRDVNVSTIEDGDRLHLEATYQELAQVRQP